MILAIDPGPTQSGWCILDGDSVEKSGVSKNEEVLEIVQKSSASALAIERVASYGMSVGREVFETCEWVGDFRNEWRRRSRGEALLIYRKDVKMHLCGTPRAKDPNIRQALIDKLGPPGKKADPGPTYGVSSHAWAALGVAVTASETLSMEPA